MTTWADIRAGDIVRLKGDDWTVTRIDYDHPPCCNHGSGGSLSDPHGCWDCQNTGHAHALDPVAVTIERQGRTVGPRGMPAKGEVERVDPTIGETVRALPAAEALAAVQLGAVVIGRKDGTQPWQVVGVDETMIHAHLYNLHGIDVVAVGSAAEAMALHLADHAAAVKAGSFVEHEHVS